MKTWFTLLIGLCLMCLVNACQVTSFTENTTVPTPRDTDAPTRMRITLPPTKTEAPTVTPRPVTPTSTSAPTDTPKPTETTITREHAWRILFRGHSCYGSSECGPAWTEDEDSNFIIWSADPHDIVTTSLTVPTPSSPISSGGRYQALAYHMKGLYIKDMSTGNEELVYPIVWGNGTNMWVGSYCWLPENQTLIFAESGQIHNQPVDSKILSLQADGTNLEILTTLPFGFIASGAGCSPDGEWVYFVDKSDLPGIYAFNLITRDVVILLQNYYVDYLTVLPREP